MTNSQNIKENEKQLELFCLETYNIKIAGDKVNEGNIQLEDYLEYLQSINNLCKSANDLLNPNTSLELKINSNIEKGSIINLIQIGISGFALFAGTQIPYPIDTVLELLGLISQEYAGLIQLLLAKKDSKIKSVIDIDDKHCRVEFEGKNSEQAYIEVAKDVIKLYADKNIRETLDAGTKILTRPGYNKIGFKKSKDEEYQYIEKDNVIHLKYDNYEEERVVTKLYTTTVDIESVPPTKLDNKWRFKESNNNQSYWAFVKDEDFKNQVREKGLLPPFSLRVQIQLTEKYMNNILIEVEKDILKVLESIEPPVQQKFIET